MYRQDTDGDDVPDDLAAAAMALDVKHLMEKLRHTALRVEKVARVESRAVGIAIGLAFELAIHIFITLMENVLLEVYGSKYGNNSTAAAPGDNNASNGDYM